LFEEFNFVFCIFYSEGKNKNDKNTETNHLCLFYRVDYFTVVKMGYLIWSCPTHHRLVN